MKFQPAEETYDLIMEPSLIVSIIALCISVTIGTLSTILAFKANGRASRAEKKAELNAERALWSDLISAVHDALTADVTAMDMRPILVNLRKSASELASGLPSDKWPHLDEWLQVEHILGAALYEQALIRTSSVSLTPEVVLQAHHNASTWCAAYLSNLRFMRQEGPTNEVMNKIPELIENASALLKETRSVNSGLSTPSSHSSDDAGAK